jgi:hypothetical protein
MCGCGSFVTLTTDRLDCKIANYRPVLSSERAPLNKNKEIGHKGKEQVKSAQGPERGVRHQDRLADWRSVVRMNIMEQIV